MSWISVEDRLPPKKKPVLIRNADGDFAKGWLTTGKWFETWDDTYDGYSKTIYWMEVPEPPESKDE
jgi:hypothetical protein